MIPLSHAAPGIAFAGDCIPVSDAGLLIGFSSGVGERSRFHSCSIVRGEARIEKPSDSKHFLVRNIRFQALVYNLLCVFSLLIKICLQEILAGYSDA